MCLKETCTLRREYAYRSKKIICTRGASITLLSGSPSVNARGRQNYGSSAKQRMERRKSLVREHSLEYKAALRRAIALDIHHAYSDSAYGTFTFTETEEGRTLEDRTGDAFVNH
ncbi:hypothetical protein GBA52_022774 [Prunus armeniaca]|nr:hypothetical protein GBA52_022774 [Prunus armeniaca]